MPIDPRSITRAACAALVLAGCSSTTEPPKTTQTITFTGPGSQILGRAAPALVASATSQLPVVITAATPSACTVSGTTLTLIAASSCTLHADQAGNAEFAPAARVSVTFPIVACAPRAEPAGSLVSFDDAAVTYTAVGFNGSAGAVVADPADACNLVGSNTRAPASQYDGVTFGTLAPANNPTIARIPFTATTNTLTLRVRVPVANTLVHLKVENAANGTINYETEVNAPLADTWQTLTFTLTAPLVGGLPGQAFNLANTYNRVSVFFAFGSVRGATPATYLFDALTLVP